MGNVSDAPGTYLLTAGYMVAASGDRIYSFRLY
jgi:hypothetical protein